LLDHINRNHEAWNPGFFLLIEEKGSIDRHAHLQPSLLLDAKAMAKCTHIEKMGNENFGVERPRSLDHTNKNPKARSCKVSLLDDRDMGA
jgi:hypothetical protein